VVVYFTVTAFRRLRQEDHEVEASQAYIRRPCLKKQRNKQTKQHKPSDII
jgi:rRNA processing protein Gar1